MKKLFALVIFLCLSFSAHAQSYPYSETHPFWQSYPITSSLGTGEDILPLLMVAASNTQLATGQKPQIVCFGTNDQDCINRAIAACGDSVTGVPGCKVELMQGVFNVNSSVSPIIIDNDDVELTSVSGCMWGGYTQPFGGASKPAGAVGNGCAQIRDSGTGNIIEIQHNNPGGTGNDTTRHRGIKIHDLYIVGNNYTSQYGIADVGAHPDDNVFIQNNIIQKTIQPIYVNLDSGDISFNSLQDNLGTAISNIAYGGCCYMRIHNNLIYDGGSTGDSPSLSYAITNYSTGAIIADNVIGDYYGGIFSYGYHTLVHGNSLNGIAGKFVNLAYCRGCNVNGNSFNNWDSNAGYIADSYISGNSPGISCLSGTGGLGATVIGNTFDTIFPTTGAAIDFTNCPNAFHSGNTFMGGWGSAANPVVSGTGTTAGTENNTFAPLSVPASVTSAILVQRLLASATTGVTTGNTLPATVLDQSGWGNNATTTGTPTYVASSLINGHPAYRFSAAGSYLTCASCYTPQTNLGRTWFGVINYTTAPTGSNTATMLNAGGGVPAIYVNASNQVCVFGGAAVCSTATLTVGNNYIVEVSLNGASTRISINGTVQTVNSGTPSTSANYAQLRLGGNGASSNVQMDIGESDFYYLAMSSADAATVASALSTAYGITITSGSANW